MTCRLSLCVALLIYFMICAGLRAQGIFREGIVTYKNGITEPMLINCRETKKTPEFIKVKRPGMPDEIETLYPGDIGSFSTIDKVFISREVTIDITSDDPNKLTRDNSRIVVNENVFLLVLVRGNLNLYLYVEDSGKNHFFIERANTGTFELERPVYYREIENTHQLGGTKSITVVPKYRTQLTEYMTGCDQFYPIINLLDYTQRDLMELFINYNDCTGSGSGYVAPIERATLQFGLVIGVNFTSIDFYGSGSPDMSVAEFSSDISSSPGIALSLVLPERRGSLSFYNELSYKSYDGNASFTESTNDQDYTNIDINLSASYIRLSNSFKFTLPGKLIRPFIHAGITNNLLLSHINEKTIEEHFYSTITTRDEMALKSVRKYEQEVFIGAGTFSGKLFIEFRCSFGNGMSGLILLTSPTRTANISMGYFF
ncbi:MAG TPA: hypothetical protein VMW76_09130 [Bacteroidales bacterium]|nr:hypothetical protein [Bacteroidales bacterium]